MKPDTFHTFLMIEKLVGTISEQDECFLDDLLAKDESAMREWNELRTRYSSADVQEIEDMNWIPSAKITGQAKRRSKLYKLKYTATIAAVLTGFCIFSYFGFWGNADLRWRIVTADIKEPLLPRHNAVTLKLPKGTVLDLTDKRFYDLKADGIVKLNNKGEQLSYIATAASNVQEKGLFHRISSSFVRSPSLLHGVNTLTVPRTKTYELVLSDGTLIKLNSGSSLRFPFTFPGKTREIDINGEALVKVARISGRPFIVHTPNGIVKVLGTEFNVNSYDKEAIKVSLIEGAVKVAYAGMEKNLAPGYTATFKDTDKKIHIQASEVDEELGWLDGRYTFKNRSLAEISETVSRMFDVSISIDNQFLKELKLSGTIERNQPIQHFLKDISTAAMISYYFDKDGKLHLTR